MTAVLAILGLGDAAWLAHWLTAHRTGLSALLATVLGWLAYRARRRFTSTGQRATGMPPLAPIATRRPELIARRTA